MTDAPRQKDGRWTKGSSPNPGGRPKQVLEVKELARQHTSAAIDALAKILTKGESESAKVAAAMALLDRGWGKAPQHITVEKSPLDDLTPATLAALAEALTRAEAGAAGGDESSTRH